MASLSWCFIYLLSQSHLQATYLCCKFWLPAQSLAITLWLLPHPSTETDLVKITDAFCRQHYHSGLWKFTPFLTRVPFWNSRFTQLPWCRALLVFLPLHLLCMLVCLELHPNYWNLSLGSLIFLFCILSAGNCSYSQDSTTIRILANPNIYLQARFPLDLLIEHAYNRISSFYYLLIHIPLFPISLNCFILQITQTRIPKDG